MHFHRRHRSRHRVPRILATRVSSAIIAFALALTLGAVTGCVTTKAWKRQHLAKPEMAADGDPDREALRTHMLGTREGAVGGFGGGGGGCGCN